MGVAGAAGAAAGEAAAAAAAGAAGAETGGEEDVRRILATVVGDEAEFVTSPIGAVLGSLTLDEAAMTVTLAENAFEGNIRITDAGRMEVAS